MARETGSVASGGRVTGDPIAGEPRHLNRERLPWGFWPTIAFTVLIMFVITAAQLIGAVFFVAGSGLDLDQANMEWLASHGSLISVATIISAPIAVGITILVIRLRKGLTVREYLGLRAPRGQELLKWVMTVALVGVVFDGISFLAGRPLVTEFVKQAYGTAGSLPLLWIALVILAPIQEEVVFRGFMFKGIQQSRIGPVGAIVLSSLGWAALHVQYDLVSVIMIFIGGLIIGTARHKTGSLHVCLGMHAVWSLMALVQVDLYYRMLLG